MAQKKTGNDLSLSTIVDMVETGRLPKPFREYGGDGDIAEGLWELARKEEEQPDPVRFSKYCLALARIRTELSPKGGAPPFKLRHVLAEDIVTQFLGGSNLEQRLDEEQAIINMIASAVADFMIQSAFEAGEISAKAKEFAEVPSQVVEGLRKAALIATLAAKAAAKQEMLEAIPVMEE
jgi:hypothetical protein